MTNIPIFLASDDNYAPFLCTTMFSILESTDSFCEFYVLDNKITKTSKTLIEKTLCNFNNYSVEYIDISNIGLDRFPNLKHYSVNTFARYFIPELKPNLGKILYLDVDIIVKSDIKELYQQDLEGLALGATSENFYEKNGIYVKKNLEPKFKDTKKYFNAGILIMDLPKIIKQNLMKICIDKTIEFADKLSCPDQDILNIVFEDNVKFINQKFDFMTDLNTFYENFYGKEVYENLKNKAVIIHYVWHKPWKNVCSNAFDDFWEIANKTLFKNSIKKALYEAEFKRISKIRLFGLFKLKKSFNLVSFIFDNKNKLFNIKYFTEAKAKIYIGNLPLLKINY